MRLATEASLRVLLTMPRDRLRRAATIAGAGILDREVPPSARTPRRSCGLPTATITGHEMRFAGTSGMPSPRGRANDPGRMAVLSVLLPRGRSWGRL